MVLYCVQHPAGILRAVIHKFKYHENEDAVIFGEYPIKSEYCQKIEGISYYQIPSVWSMVSFSQDRSALIQNIQSTIDCFMENLTLHFSDFSAIYAIYDMYNPFTAYFELNNIKYMCVELNNNVFKHYWDGTFIQTRCDKGKTFNELVYELHSQDGQGRNCLKGYLFSYESKVPEGGTVPLEVFDYYGTLLTLNERCKNQLIRAYDLDKYTFDCLMMFNSPGWTGTVLGQYGICLTYDEKKDTNENVFKFYKSVIDYYFNDIDFTLKLHPASGIDFSEAFSCFEQLSNKILIELFALTGKQFRIICPINSSGEGVFRKLGFNITAFGLEIISFFKHIHFVKLAFSYIQQVTKPDKIYVYGLDINQVNYFKEFVFKPFKDVQIEQLTCENVKDAAYAVVVPNNEFSHVAELLGGECTIILKGDFDISVMASRKMKCSVVDISGGG